MRDRSFYRPRFPAVLVIIAALSCSDPVVERGPTRVRDSAGIEIITNLGPVPDAVTLDSTAVRIGGIDVAEEYMFQQLSDVALLGDGSVIVVDGVGRVAKFDSTGRWVRDFGRSGSGPGEFRRPLFAEIVGDTVAIWDARLARLSLFTTRGVFLDLVPIQKRGTLPVHWRGDVWVDELEWGQRSDRVAAGAMVVRMEANEVVDTLKGPYPVPEFRVSGLDDGRIMVRHPPVFSVRPPWRVCEQRLLWTDPQGPRVEQFGLTGGLQRVIELARLPREIGASDREAYATAMAARWDLGEEGVAEILRDGEFVTQAPFVGGLVCGVDGAVWASHFDPAVPEPIDAVGSTWDEIDASGRVIAQVSFPRGFVLKAVGRGRAYGIARRELGVNVVEIYELPPGR